MGVLVDFSLPPFFSLNFFFVSRQSAARQSVIEDDDGRKEDVVDLLNQKPLSLLFVTQIFVKKTQQKFPNLFLSFNFKFYFLEF